ncbi:MAG: hypothetical protein RRZ67_03070 [Victivallaceae bacterium]
MSSSIGGAGGNAPIQGPGGGDDKKRSPVGKLQTSGKTFKVEKEADNKAADEAARKTSEASGGVEKQYMPGYEPPTPKSTYREELTKGFLPQEKGTVTRLREKFEGQKMSGGMKDSAAAVTEGEKATAKDSGVRSKLNELGSKVKEKAAAAGEKMSQAGQTVKGLLSDAGEKMSQAGQTVKGLLSDAGEKMKALGKKSGAGSDEPSTSGTEGSDEEVVYTTLDFSKDPQLAPSPRKTQPKESVIYSEVTSTSTSHDVEEVGVSIDNLLQDFEEVTLDPEQLVNPTKFKQFSQKLEQIVSKLKGGLGQLGDKLKARSGRTENSSLNEGVSEKLRAALDNLKGSLQQLKASIGRAFDAIKARCLKIRSSDSKDVQPSSEEVPLDVLSSSEEVSLTPGENSQFTPVLMERSLNQLMAQLDDITMSLEALDPSDVTPESGELIYHTVLNYQRLVGTLTPKLEAIMAAYRTLTE